LGVLLGAIAWSVTRAGIRNITIGIDGVACRSIGHGAVRSVVLRVTRRPAFAVGRGFRRDIAGSIVRNVRTAIALIAARIGTIRIGSRDVTGRTVDARVR
jgi:hypothetical protein